MRGAGLKRARIIQLVHRENWNRVVCAHIKDAAINVRAMYENSIKQMPSIGGVKFSLKPFQQTQNIKRGARARLPHNGWDGVGA